ncbi:major head protein [Citrobacter phage HCF1]|uniref:Major capsid protein n=1 Tax=Citrobacter phage HCF1 TaxID=2849700 RepID=A0ABX6D769_9CAUD|nr:major head protein [Citrobacter phage HCF1]
MFRLGNAFLISIDEIKAGARTGKSLSTRKANAAQLAHDQLVNKLVFKGSKPHKIPSVFEHPNITKIVSAKWMDGATKSRKPHRMNWRKQSRRLRLRLTGCTAQLTFRKVLSVRMPETTESYLQYFQKQNAGITFEAVSELENYDGAGNKAVLVYEKIRTSEFGKVFRLGNAFLISIDEIKAGARTGKSLSTRKANAAQLAHDQLVNKLVFKGSKPHKIPSVFEHPNITKIVSAKWMDGATKSRKPHRMNWRKQSRRLRLRLTGCTAQLTFNMSIEIPEAFNMLPAQAKDLHFKIPCTSKCTGLTIYRPLTLVLITGV